MLSRRWLLPCLAAAGLLGGAMLLQRGHDGEGISRDRAIGLFGTLPILWRETDRLSDLIADDAAPPHWAMPVLQGVGTIRPLDALAGSGEAPSLAGLHVLVMAQPRPLSPLENVALDRWVRAGGRVLLFADPLLTVESAFPLGDERRPQDTILLSPILTRWGLRLEFDEDQPAGERRVTALDVPMPVNLPGRLVSLDAALKCRFEASGVVAYCRIGKGRALVIADAAVLENLPRPASREEALGRLLSVLATED